MSSRFFEAMAWTRVSYWSAMPSQRASRAGVAWSVNDWRWRPELKREDGLARLVLGLGTRAVDRTVNDFPVLIVPGQPELRVNVAIDEILRYSPSAMDVINLETNGFETVPVGQLLREVGGRYPGLPLVFSTLRDGRLAKPVSLLIDPEKEHLVPTFDEARRMDRVEVGRIRRHGVVARRRETARRREEKEAHHREPAWPVGSTGAKREKERGGLRRHGPSIDARTSVRLA